MSEPSRRAAWRRTLPGFAHDPAPLRARPRGGGARRRLGAHEAQRVAGCAHWLAGRRRADGEARLLESRQKLGDLSVRVLDRDKLDIDNEFVVERLRTLALTIAAGTSQIQRNIISERLLGLPREQQWTSN